MATQNVVVVGGGGAGAAIARCLSQKLNPTLFTLILITSSDIYLHRPALARMLVSGAEKVEDKALIPYDNLFANGNGLLKVGTVIGVEDNGTSDGGHVIVEDGEKIPYKYLVLAPGSIWTGTVGLPNRKEDIVDYLGNWRAKFQQAQSICIVGGGVAGLELAGELRDAYTDKDITLVHGDRMVLNGTYPDSFRVCLEHSYRARNIKIILGDRIKNIPDEEKLAAGITTQQGVPLYPDLIVPTGGRRPNTAFLSSLKKNDGSSIVLPDGQVDTLPTFQIPDHPNVFVAGDVTSFQEQKQVQKYQEHANVVVANIMALIGNNKLKTYSGVHEAVYVTNGRSGGYSYVGLLWELILGPWLTTSIKSKGLFIAETRRSLGMDL